MRSWYKRSGSTPRLPETPSRDDMATEDYQHRGYRAVFYRQGEGWCVEIYPPGSSTCELVISYAGAEADRDILLDDITQLIDRQLDLKDTSNEGGGFVIAPRSA